MQQWGYLEVYVGTYFGDWGDSLGRAGKLATVQPEGGDWRFISIGPMLNRLGEQGREVVALYEASYNTTGARRILLKRPK